MTLRRPKSHLKNSLGFELGNRSKVPKLARYKKLQGNWKVQKDEQWTEQRPLQMMGHSVGGGLKVIAHDTGAPPTGRHRAGIGINIVCDLLTALARQKEAGADKP